MYIAIFSVGLLFLIILLVISFKDKNKNDGANIKEGQIQIVKGDEIVTINENGLVEYKSKDRVYYETWDTSKIDSFFSLMEQKARDYINKKTSGGDCGYKVYMFLNGKLVTICLDSADEDMANTVEEVYVKYSDLNLSDFFSEASEDDDNDENDDDDEFGGVIYFPTSTPVPGRVTATPTPNSAYNDNTNYAPVVADCDTWSADIVNNRAIISNTFCTVDAAPTP